MTCQYSEYCAACETRIQNKFRIVVTRSVIPCLAKIHNLSAYSYYVIILVLCIARYSNNFISLHPELGIMKKEEDVRNMEDTLLPGWDYVCPLDMTRR